MSGHNVLMVTQTNASGAVIDELQEFAAGHPDVEALFLFGSHAAGTARETSDVDVAILFRSHPDESASIRLSLSYCVELEDRLHGKVDVVVLNTASPMLRFQVVRKGKMIYSTDSKRTRRFIGDAIVEFYDEIVMLETIQKCAIRRAIGR